MKGDPKHMYKTTRKSEKCPDGKPALAGNVAMDLKAVWEVVHQKVHPGAATPNADHHNPEWDVSAMEAIFFDPDVTKLMWSNSHTDGVPNGAHALEHEAGLVEVLAHARESLEQHAPPGWVVNPQNVTEHCARLKCTPGCSGVHVGGGTPKLPACGDAEGPTKHVKG